MTQKQTLHLARPHTRETKAVTCRSSFLTCTVLLRPCSKVILKFLDVMQKHGYIGEYEVVDNHRSNKVVVTLLGRINKAGVISPRFNIRQHSMDKWSSNLLPSRQFGFMVLTTSAGIMDHEEAKKKHTGGKVLGFFY